jgi:hypothetical protein
MGMRDLLLYLLPVIALIAGAFLVYYVFPGCIMRIDLTKAS